MSSLNIHPLQRVIVVRALPGLGDMLCAIPALRALRAGLPEASIALLGLPWARAFMQRFSGYMDDFIDFPGYPGIPERPVQVHDLPAFFSAVHSRHFDLAVQMHGSGITSNPFTVLLGARANAGLYIPGEYCPNERYFLPYDEVQSEVTRYVKLMQFLGMPSQGDDLEFPLQDADFQALHAIPQARDLLPGEYICIHPGSKELDRRWPVERYAAVADAMSARGLRVVLTGTAIEAGLTRSLARHMRTRPIDLAGRTTLGAMAALLKGARLLLCNDTGVSHLAAALRVPSVVIFTVTAPSRWAPLDRDLHRVVEPTATALPTVKQVLSEALTQVYEGARQVNRQGVATPVTGQAPAYIYSPVPDPRPPTPDPWQEATPC